LFICHGTGEMKENFDRLGTIWKLTDGFTNNDEGCYSPSDATPLSVS
jgi:hypothetical protein